MSDLRKLLNKKNLTGEEIGKALISHSIVLIKNAKIVDGKISVNGIFTDNELDKMVQSLNTKQDVECYNGYREILNTIRHLLTKLELVLAEYKAAEWQALYVFSNCLYTEAINTARCFDPLIITKEQFEEEKRKEITDKENWITSHVNIVKNVIIYFLDLYEKNLNAENPFKEEFNKLENIEVNEDEKNEYEKVFCVSYCYETPDGKRSDQMTLGEWRELTEQYEAFTVDFVPSSKYPIEYRKFNISLECIRNNKSVSDDILEIIPFQKIELISPLKESLSKLRYLQLLTYRIIDDTEKIDSFLREYRSLIEIAIDYMNTSKALKHEAKATVSAMTQKEFIINLYNNKFIYYNIFFEIEVPECLSHIDYAILQGTNKTIKKFQTIQDEFLVYENSLSVLAIAACANRLKQSYNRANSIYYFFKMISQEINISELMDLVGYGEIDVAPIEHLNDIGDSIKRCITRYSDYSRRDTNKTAEALAIFENAFAKIAFDAMKPTKESQAEAMKLIRVHDDLFDKQEQIIAILERGQTEG